MNGSTVYVTPDAGSTERVTRLTVPECFRRLPEFKWAVIELRTGALYSARVSARGRLLLFIVGLIPSVWLLHAVGSDAQSLWQVEYGRTPGYGSAFLTSSGPSVEMTG